MEKHDLGLPIGTCLDEAPHYPHTWTPASAQVWWCPGVKSPWLLIELNDTALIYCGMYTSRDSAVLAMISRQTALDPHFRIEDVTHVPGDDRTGPAEMFTDGDCWRTYIVLASDAEWKPFWFGGEGEHGNASQ